MTRGRIVALAHRVDAYAQALADLEAVETWADFSEAVAAIRKRMQDANLELQELERAQAS